MLNAVRKSVSGTPRNLFFGPPSRTQDTPFFLPACGRAADCVQTSSFRQYLNVAILIISSSNYPLARCRQARNSRQPISRPQTVVARDTALPSRLVSTVRNTRSEPGGRGSYLTPQYHQYSGFSPRYIVISHGLFPANSGPELDDPPPEASLANGTFDESFS